MAVKSFIVQAPGVLNKDPRISIDGARPPPIAVLVLPLPENEFDEAGSAMSNGREPKSWLGRVFNFKLVSFTP